MHDPALQAALARELHVWIADPDALPAHQLIGQYLPLLDQEETLRYRRFHFDRDRLHFLAAHALLRTTLSRYAACPPQAWRFVRGPHGKPELDPAAGLPPLRFNLSHTHGMVACVIALDGCCGIDVEYVRPLNDLQGLARTVLSEEENATLAVAPEADRLETFFSYWTLKEAYVKATGQGMSASLKSITFALANGPGQAGVKFDNDIDDDAASWRFQRFKPTPDCRLAVAAKPASAREIVCHALDWTDTRRYRVLLRQILTS